MNLVDLTAQSIFVLFGLWWLFFPRSVTRFYTSFHQRYGFNRPLPRPLTIRIVGLAWLLLLAVVSWRAARG
jgi:hypothetical protein